MDVSKTTWHWIQTLVKMPAEAESLQCEYQVVVAVCSWKHRFLAFVYSGTAIRDGSGRGKQQQRVKPYVGPGEAIICLSSICVSPWSRCLCSLASLPSPLFNVDLWVKLRGEKVPAPSWSCAESKAASADGVCSFTSVTLHFKGSVWKHDLCFFHYAEIAHACKQQIMFVEHCGSSN